MCTMEAKVLGAISTAVHPVELNAKTSPLSSNRRDLIVAIVNLNELSASMISAVGQENVC